MLAPIEPALQCARIQPAYQRYEYIIADVNLQSSPWRNCSEGGLRGGRGGDLDGVCRYNEQRCAVALYGLMLVL